MSFFRRRKSLNVLETRNEHEKIIKRLDNVEDLVRRNATRLKRLELEVGIFKPGPIVDEEEAS